MKQIQNNVQQNTLRQGEAKFIALTRRWTLFHDSYRPLREMHKTFQRRKVYIFFRSHR